ncbi:transmembrane protein 53 isoform X2 [Protopterus annectens]|uniref:transmembrane protein 53 isoform X2 n=1 Tax=Protopterus annectens TaxID=7888 RepID=UPI001CFB764B|nr:transmembrane protein 53 isoform X2 [Protopterus annectens]
MRTWTILSHFLSLPFQGCIVIRYTAPWKAVFISESFGKKDLLPVAQKLLNLLFDYEIQKNPVMFHIFSNGGSMVYRYITELHQSHSQFSSLNIIGTVFDSGPGGKNVVGAAKALNVVLKSTSNVVVRYITLSFYVFLIVILRVFLYPLTKLIHEDHYSVMSNDQSRSPQLYLYSRGDKVINYRHVENLVKKRQQMGVPVQSIDFVTSEHVNHYREFPDDYSSVCILFLKDCLTRMAKPSRKDLSSKRAFPAAAAASLK